MTHYVPWAYKPVAHRCRRLNRFFPLTAVVFEILLALAGGDLHGYDIMREVESRSGGSVVLHAGTLYRALARPAARRLVEELDERPDPATTTSGGATTG